MLDKLHGFEIDWIMQMQKNLRVPALDHFFRAWDHIDSFSFMIIIITYVWYMIDKKEGVKLFYILILSGAINTSLKVFLSLPRPCHIQSSVGIICPSTFGMPSGASQSAALLGTILFFRSKKLCWKFLAISYGLFLPFSRVYLGAHFISDVIVGMIIGAILAFVYFHIFPLMKYWKNEKMLLFPVLILLIGGPFALLFCSLTLGMQLGLVAKKMDVKRPNSTFRRLGGVILSSTGIVLLSYFAIKAPPLQLVFGLVMGVWHSYLVPILLTIGHRKG